MPTPRGVRWSFCRCRAVPTGSPTPGRCFSTSCRSSAPGRQEIVLPDEFVDRRGSHPDRQGFVVAHLIEADRIDPARPQAVRRPSTCGPSRADVGGVECEQAVGAPSRQEYRAMLALRNRRCATHNSAPANRAQRRPTDGFRRRRRCVTDRAEFQTVQGTTSARRSSLARRPANGGRASRCARSQSAGRRTAGQQARGRAR